MIVDAAKISRFSRESFTKLGMSEEDADTVTTTMLEADYRGIHSHGFLRLPIYVKRIKKNFIQVPSKVTVEMETEAMALLDGHYSAGQVVGKKTMEKAMELARNHGIGMATAKHSNHFGIAAHYALMAAEQNMLGIVMSNVEPLMPAIGGAEKVIGNNPIAFASPTAEGDPIVLDMALSNAPLGKILFAQAQGKEIPKGWGVDKNGEATTDPAQVLDGGFLSPVAGPKGFGLAIFAEILTGILTGSQFSKSIPSMYDMKEKQSISHFMLAIDLSQFVSGEEYGNRIKTLTSFVKESKKAPGVDDLYMPGEIEFERERKNKESGIAMEENVLQELYQLSDELGVSLKEVVLQD
ncbi:Ldh family oxidoreductase [Halalkalibacter oceani]|uniref:Ldh family oxidoreductase n=1 Tax=Halalkalibacter oceani TaxID=1653776 RepID=A0A9X2IPR1_9BACI|nr:Ldh family oxidoreductase [Halalkalibacter oceani]MCM3714697.1 Ldh family oxidoreductase [Halalkalibacter oceani]